MKPNYKCYVKGTSKEEGSPRNSFNWIFARRDWLKFYDDRLELGNWRFYHSEINNPVLYKTRSMLIEVKILDFVYEDKHYQFGINSWPKILPHLSVEVKVEKIRMRRSLFSILIRVVVVVAYLIKMFLP